VVEDAQNVLAGPNANAFGSWWANLRQDLFFHCQARLDVEVRGFGTFVAEVKGNYFCGDIRFQQGHCRRVPKRMRGDMTLLERWQLGGGTLDQSLELVSGPRTAEPLADAVGQQGSLERPAIVFQPSTQSSSGLRAQWHPPLLAPLAQQFDFPVYDIHLPYPEC